MSNKIFKIIILVIAVAYFVYYALTLNSSSHFIDTVDLIFHEAGHTIFFFTGDFFRMLAGSAFQVFIPLFFSLYFYFSNQKFSGALCLLWVGQNLLNVSVYAGDAVNMSLDLLGGDSVIHDWNYLLVSLGLLNKTILVSKIIYYCGIAFGVIGSILSLKFSLKKEDILL